jgi:hypothetical protein
MDRNVQFPKLRVDPLLIEPLIDRAEEVAVVNLQFDMVGEGLDARMLECVKRIPDRADVVDAAQQVGVIQVVWRPTVIEPQGMIMCLDASQNGIDGLALVVPARQLRVQHFYPR